MSEEKNDVTRREALKSLGVLATLPVLGSSVAAQSATHQHTAPSKPAAANAPGLRFFTEAENRALIELSERIIPADDNSPGAREAKVSEYIDILVSLGNEQVKKNWRDGLAAINQMSRDRFGKEVADASVEQQVELLTALSRNEKSPQTVEEKFFKLVKNATIDGYYTSEIGIHKELKYRGNTYLKDFIGCTHPEHQKG